MPVVKTGRERRIKTKECDQMEGGWGVCGERWRAGGKGGGAQSSPDIALTLPLDLLFAPNAAVAVVITAADVTV